MNDIWTNPSVVVFIEHFIPKNENALSDLKWDKENSLCQKIWFHYILSLALSTVQISVLEMYAKECIFTRIKRA